MSNGIAGEARYPTVFGLRASATRAAPQIPGAYQLALDLKSMGLLPIPVCDAWQIAQAPP